MPNLSLLVNNSSTIKNALVNALVKSGAGPPRMPVLRRPDHYGLEFKDVDIMSSDGVRLSAWQITRSDTKKLAIVNHPLMCNRWGTIKGVDNVPVEFIPMLKHLYVAGYSIITYDQRGQGESDGGFGKSAKGPKPAPCAAGGIEWKDFVGVATYVKANFSGHDVALIGFCMGANSIFKTFTEAPETFDGLNVKCFAAVQPTRSKQLRQRMFAKMIGVDISDELEKAFVAKFGVGGVDVVDHAPNVNVPLMCAQVKADIYAGDSKGHDVQAIFDAATSSPEKKLFWFGPGTQHPFGNGLRFEGYNFFNYHPEPLVGFLNTYCGGASLPPTNMPQVAESKWQRDEDHPNCQECGKRFTLRIRRHHCRTCGRVLAKSCVPKRINGQKTCVACWVHSEVNKMPTTSTEPDSKIITGIEIDAPAAVVWQTLTDFGNLKSWSTSMQNVTGDFKEGGNITITFKFMGLEFNVQHTIRDFQQGCQWSWSDEMGEGISNNHLYRVEVVDETHARFVNNDELSGGDAVVRYGTVRAMQASYEQFNIELRGEAEKRYAQAAQ